MHCSWLLWGEVWSFKFTATHSYPLYLLLCVPQPNSEPTCSGESVQGKQKLHIHGMSGDCECNFKLKFNHEYSSFSINLSPCIGTGEHRDKKRGWGYRKRGAVAQPLCMCRVKRRQGEGYWKRRRQNEIRKLCVCDKSCTKVCESSKSYPKDDDDDDDDKDNVALRFVGLWLVCWGTWILFAIVGE